MKTQGSRWNEVVAAYEDSLDLLEAARKEYSDAVVETLDELKKAAEERLAKVVPADGVERAGIESGKGRDFAQDALYNSLLVEEIEWATVHAWVGAPHAGPAATLRIGVEVKRHTELFPWDHTWLTQAMGRVKTDLSPCNIESLSAIERWTGDWAWMTDIDLRLPTSSSDAADAFARSVEAAAALTTVLAERAEPVRLARDVLRDLRRKVEKKPLAKEQRLDPKNDLGIWDGTSYFSVILDDVGMSVGTDPKDGTLLYIHDPDREPRPKLSSLIGERLGVTPATRRGYSCGILLDRSALRSATRSEILARCEEALRVFAELTSQK